MKNKFISETKNGLYEKRTATQNKGVCLTCDERQDEHFREWPQAHPSSVDTNQLVSRTFHHPTILFTHIYLQRTHLNIFNVWSHSPNSWLGIPNFWLYINGSLFFEDICIYSIYYM